MNVTVFFQTLAELYARQHKAVVSSITIQEKDTPRASE